METQKLNTKFCSPIFITQDAIFITMYTLRLIPHWCAQTFKSFPLFILFTLFTFYLVLFCLVLNHNFTFNPIHGIISKESLIQFSCYYSVFRIIFIIDLCHFTLLFVRRGLGPFSFFL